MIATPPTQRPASSVLRLAGAALAVAAIVALNRISPTDTPPAADAQPAGIDRGPSIDGLETFGLLPPDERVAFWEARVAAGGSHLDLIHLADAYLDRSRSAGALDDLQRAATALDRAAETAPYPDQVAVRRALVAFALHDFPGAMRHADAVLSRTPTDLAALGVAGDARLEMGDLDGARERYETLARLAPSPAAWSRLARLAFLTGDRDGAIQLVARAAAAARDEGAPDSVAFYGFQLGELHRSAGNLAHAEAAYRAALAALPDYVPAMAGLAGVHAARGHREQAISLLERATAQLPRPELVAALGDLYALEGDAAMAERQFALVESIARLANDGAPVYDRQLILFASDHERNVEEAVVRARADLAIRGDVYGHDALAWALYRAGQFDEASQHAAAALALGTPDPRLAYHAGLIAVARGELDRGMELLRGALEGAAYLPPLQAEAARAALLELEAEARP